MASRQQHRSKMDRVRLQSVEINSEDLDEVESLYDAAEPCYAVVYRSRQGEGTPSTSGGGGVRVVSCIKAEVEERYSRKIFGRMEDFVRAVTYLVDESERECSHALDLPACCVFDAAPSAASARAVIQENRTLIRHFAPVLDVDPAMNLLYERQLFKIRSGPKGGRGRHVGSRSPGPRSRAPYREAGRGAPSSLDDYGTSDGDYSVSHGRHGRDADPETPPGVYEEGGGWKGSPVSPAYDAPGGRGRLDAEPRPPGTLQRTRSLGERSKELEGGGGGGAGGSFLYSTMPVDPFPWQGVADQDDRSHGRSPKYGAPRDKFDHQQYMQEPPLEEGESHHLEPPGRAGPRRRMQEPGDFDDLGYDRQLREGGEHDQPSRRSRQEAHRHDDDWRYGDDQRQYQDDGRRYQDEGRRYQDEGRWYEDEERRYQDEGQRYQDEGRRYQDEGRRHPDEYGDEARPYQHHDEYHDEHTPVHGHQQPERQEIWKDSSADERCRRREVPPKGYPSYQEGDAYLEDGQQYGEEMSAPGQYGYSKNAGHKPSGHRIPEGVPPLKSIQSLHAGRAQDWQDGQAPLHSPQGQGVDWEADTAPAQPAPEAEKPNQSKFTMEVDPRETVGSLKQKIYKARGYHPNVQRLVFDGTILSDKMRLADCNVTEDSTLVLWLLLGKGRAVRVM
ncbi:unnamed protein product [Ostreobium quekettii]|uniref:Ubiquitin-like domain-containing protein n=1 Tax=Ostreobium quekettii TaxID=121088 RepID=A0A8S1ISV5_9CHLO|nr:unnamed protein product [Ostreobium quekettii]|eukprot:evm.model.scf_191.6 EVM.evm.TU.scf_191.6   scf_191:50692-54208(+)